MSLSMPPQTFDPGGGPSGAPVPRMIWACRSAIATHAFALDRLGMAELLSGHLQVAGPAQVLGILVHVLATMGERNLVVHFGRKANDVAI